MFQIDENNLQSRAKIKIIGVGGGGGNAIKNMYTNGLNGVEFIVANTDVQALEEHEDLDWTIQLGTQITKGLGAGANPEIGRQAAIESCNEIKEALKGADMVFITAGMGGGTGTGAAGVIARIAKDQGALTVGVVTRPFFFEGQKRAKHAETGIQFLKENVDTLIVIPNQKLLKITENTTSLLSAFKKVDDILLQSVQGIVNLINKKGLINLDFADIKTIMSEQGLAIIGTGSATGENRARLAAQQTITSTLLEDTSFKGAMGVIINITGDSDLSLQEVNDIAELITSEAHQDAEIIFGALINTQESIKQITVTVIATGFEGNNNPTPSINNTKPVSNSPDLISSKKLTTPSSLNNPTTKSINNTPPVDSIKSPKDQLLQKALNYKTQSINQETITPNTQLSMNIQEKKNNILKKNTDIPFKKSKSNLLKLFKKNIDNTIS